MSPPEQHKKVIRGRHHSLYHTHTHTWWSVGRDIYSEEEEVLFSSFFSVQPFTCDQVEPRITIRERSLSLICVCVCLYSLVWPLYGYKRKEKEEEDILDFRGVPHLFLLGWPELRLYITFFLPRNKKKMFTTRKVYSPYGISYIPRKKRDLKNVWKNIKELGRSAKQSGGGGSRPLVCAPLFCKDKSIG